MNSVIQSQKQGSGPAASHKDFTITLCTFNMGNAYCDAFDKILRSDNPTDIYVIGLQESTYTSKSVGNKVPAYPSATSKAEIRNSAPITRKSLTKGRSTKNMTINWVNEIEVEIEYVLGNEYEKKQYNQRAQMLIFVYAKKELDISNIVTSAENTGFAGVLPNKGGLCVSMNVNGTSLAFISCHLAAHEGPNKCQDRNASIEEILGGVRAISGQLDVTMECHHTFLMGDLNYRLTFDERTPADLKSSELQKEPKPSQAKVGKHNSNDIVPFFQNFNGDKDREEDDDEFENQEMTPERKVNMKQVFEWISDENWAALLEKDELLRELRASRLLVGFVALTPSFPPTFKRKRNVFISNDHPSVPDSCLQQPNTTDLDEMAKVEADVEEEDLHTKWHDLKKFYDLKRMPSYTDRILYKSLPGHTKSLEELSFESIEAVLTSDHKPVRGVFRLTTVSKNLMDLEAVEKNILRIPVSLRPTSKRVVKEGSNFCISIGNLRGHQLAEMDAELFGGGSDPYVVVGIDPPNLLYKKRGGQLLQTAAVKHNLDPYWKEQLKVKLKNVSSADLVEGAHLLLSVWDYDAVTAHDLIGTCVIPFSDILISQEGADPVSGKSVKLFRSFTAELPLLNKGLKQGFLSMTIQVGIGVYPDVASYGLSEEALETVAKCGCQIA